MSQYIAPSPLQLTRLILGDISTTSWTLPGSATTSTLFTVTGNILVNMLVGQVVTLIGSTAVNLSLGTAPTTGTLDTDGLGTATAITSAEVGTLISAEASSGLGGALAVGSLAGSAVFLPGPPFVVAPGTITATVDANAGGGAVNWYLGWVPLDNFATVA